MASLGLTTHSRIVDSTSLSRESEIAARLGLPPTAPIVRLERLRLAQQEPVALEVGYWSEDEFPDLLRSTLKGMSLFSAMEHDCGVALAYADEEIDATDADQRLADLLRVGKSTPLLRIRQLIFSTTGKATLMPLASIVPDVTRYESAVSDRRPRILTQILLGTRHPQLLLLVAGVKLEPRSRHLVLRAHEASRPAYNCNPRTQSIDDAGVPGDHPVALSSQIHGNCLGV